MPTLARRLAAEFLGTGALLTAIVGSGIAAESLSSDAGLRLGINAAATALALVVILTIFIPISGAHLHPFVSVAAGVLGDMPWKDALAYLPVQLAGGIAGTVIANLMFEVPAIAISTNERASAGSLLAEVAATAGLLLVIVLLARTARSRFIPVAVGAYIGAAYFATSSTSFANPAVTIARMLSDTFTGIAPGSAALFVAAQAVGAVAGVWLAVLLAPVAERRATSSRAVD